MICYQPPGNNIFCVCHKEIDVSSAPTTEVEVEPKENTEVQGGSWWSRFTRPKKAPVKTGPVQRRRKLTCPSCSVSVQSVCMRACMRISGRFVEVP